MRHTLLAAGLAAVATAATPGVLHADAPRGVIPVRSRQFELRLQLDRSGGAADRVDVFLSSDSGRTWTRQARPTDATGTVRLTVGREGLWGVYVVARNAAGSSGPEPTAGTAPQIWCLIDTQKPLVQLHGVRLGADPQGHRVVMVRWNAYDANLPPRPVRLHYRLPGQTEWQPVTGPLVNTGRYDWLVPDSLTGLVQVKVAVGDRVGHVTERVAGAINLAGKPAARVSPAATVPRAPRPTSMPIAPTVTHPAVPAAAPLTPATRRDVEQLYKHAAWYLLRGELPQAEQRLKEILAVAPAHVSAQNDLAGILYRRGQYAPAATSYRKVLSFSPSHRKAWRGLALAQVAQRDYAGARTSLQHLLALDPENGDAWLNLGDVSLMMGQRGLARSYWTRATEVAQDDPEVLQRARRRLAAYTIVSKNADDGPDADR